MLQRKVASQKHGLDGPQIGSCRQFEFSIAPKLRTWAAASKVATGQESKPTCRSATPTSPAPTRSRSQEGEKQAVRHEAPAVWRRSAFRWASQLAAQEAANCSKPAFSEEGRVIRHALCLLRGPPSLRRLGWEPPAGSIGGHPVSVCSLRGADRKARSSI